jgi:hypothetical protein
VAAGGGLAAQLAIRTLEGHERQLGEALPDPVRKRLEAVRQARLMLVAITVGLLVTRYTGYALSIWFLAVVALFVVINTITGVLVWRETAAAAAPAPEDWAQTPYDDLSSFDLFVSYKSEDVRVVRAVVDRLLGRGVRVWFAEYVVLLSGREAFQEAIDAGITRSSHAVVFSNDRYAGSDHCKRELDLIFSPEGPGVGRTFEVRLPPEPNTHRYKADLAHAHWMECDGDVDAVVESLAAFIGAPTAVAGSDEAVEPAVWFRDTRRGWAIDIAGWSEHTSSASDPGVPAWARDVAGRRLRLNVHVGPGTVAPRPVAEDPHDREVFDRSIAFAEEFLRVNGRRPVAVHLLHLGGYSHLVVAYWLGSAWARRYSIVLPDPSTGESIELAFAFGFFGPFAEYCRAVPLMDRVVESLSWPEDGLL